MDTKVKKVVINYDLDTNLMEVIFKSELYGTAEQFDPKLEKMMKSMGNSGSMPYLPGRK